MIPLVALIFGCISASQADEAPPDFDKSVDRVVATLEEAVRQDRAQRSDDALAAWDRARMVYVSDLRPTIHTELGDREAVRLDYGFGLVGSEIKARRGSPRGPVSELIERLHADIDLLVVNPDPG